MVERRNPLVLSSTRTKLRSVLNSLRPVFSDGERVPNHDGIVLGGPDLLRGNVRLSAGILRCHAHDDAKLDDSALVVIKNIEIGIQRVAQVVVLDPPNTLEDASVTRIPVPGSLHTMLVFPTYDLMVQQLLLDQEVAYLSPMLAFNLSSHISCLISLVHQGNGVLDKYFEAKFDKELIKKSGSQIGLDLETVSKVPGCASHLRVSFVKIPECAEERQGLIDSALHKYFGTDRQLSRGDVFRIYIDWNCGSSICIPCSQRLCSESDEFIYFKVVAMEASNERFLLVNNSQPALVFGGTVSSGLPPDLLVSRSKVPIPLQEDIVNILASVLSPPLCPSALASKLRVSVLLHGLPGCGKKNVVNYVARRLGLHVVEYSFHSLLASSERKTSAALAPTFNMATRYSPTILLLRHFDALKNLGSQDGSMGDRVGVSSEIASVIRELTEPVSNGDYSSMEEHSNGNISAEEVGKFRGHQVLRCFSHEIRMGSLNDEQRSEMLSQSLQGVSQLLDVYLFSSGLRKRSGVFLYCPPGTGK
ncbi:hypothetical protein CARUB_v10011916mg, partial [Capsella rubella]